MNDEEAGCSAAMKIHPPVLHEQMFHWCPNCKTIWPCEVYTRAITVLAAMEALGRLSYE